MYHVTQAEKANKARKSAVRSTLPENRWRIEGMFYSVGELAIELGCSRYAAGDALRSLQRASGAITMARLRQVVGT